VLFSVHFKSICGITLKLTGGRDELNQNPAASCRPVKRLVTNFFMVPMKKLEAKIIITVDSDGTSKIKLDAGFAQMGTERPTLDDAIVSFTKGFNQEFARLFHMSTKTNDEQVINLDAQ